MFVSLNSEWDEARLNASVLYNKIAKFWLVLSNQILLDEAEAARLNGGLMELGVEDSLVEFLDSDREFKYLETLVLMHFLYWEPAVNGFDMESLSVNLQQASFTHETALRVIANVNTAENSIQVEQHIQVFYGMISEIIVGLNQMPDVFIDSFVMEEPQELAEIILEVQEKIVDLLEIVKSKPVAFYCNLFPFNNASIGPIDC
jgi:hypothetical protein